jgi:hypothetical protein
MYTFILYVNVHIVVFGKKSSVAFGLSNDFIKAQFLKCFVSERTYRKTVSHGGDPSTEMAVSSTF